MNHARRRVGTGGWARLALLLGLAGLGACDRSPGASIGCDTDGDCADGDECTADACGGDGLCRYAPADLDGDGYGARCGGGDDSDDHDPTVHPDAVERCDDGRDQDSDGLVDCDDPDCARDPACWQPPPEICDNGFDDDGDGLLDCEDPECEAAEACCVPAAEACDDGRDNDCDGVADCDDPDCAGHAACALDTPEVCDDWVDNDGDLFMDCLDPDCAEDPACVLRPEQCGNGVDDDGDDLWTAPTPTAPAPWAAADRPARWSGRSPGGGTTSVTRAGARRSPGCTPAEARR